MISRRALLRLVGVTLCVAAVVAIFAISTPIEPTAPREIDFATPGTAAMRAAIDPETGQLVTGPAAERLAETGADKQADAELEQMLSRSDAGLQQVHRPDGTVSVNLEGRFMSASVARIGADGKVETLCAEDAAAAEAFLADKPGTDANGLEVQ
jgi:hypothetical protein